MSVVPVELGFAERAPSWKLRSKFFRSKIGGLPSWLCLDKLPDPSNVQCKSCGKPSVFLLQVYAPVPEVEESFHRTIFIFMCTNGKCNKKNKNDSFIIFRSQLPRKNEFYSFQPPVDKEADSHLPSADQYQKLCDVCGCKSEIQCIKCDKKNYCGQDHQNMDWNRGHRDLCGVEMTDKAKKKKSRNKFLLPEFELVTETEDVPEAAPEKSDAEKMKEYRQFMATSHAPKEFQDDRTDGLEKHVKKSDKIFNKFQKRVKLEPEQVLRYQRGGAPLWVSSEHIPKDAEIPRCSCGAQRIFEFQVMPQMLNYLSLDAVDNSVDWGSLFIYTCAKSCKEGTSGYTKEFIWKQDFADDADVKE